MTLSGEVTSLWELVRSNLWINLYSVLPTDSLCGARECASIPSIPEFFLIKIFLSWCGVCQTLSLFNPSLRAKIVPLPRTILWHGVISQKLPPYLRQYSPCVLMLKTLEYVCSSLEGKSKARDLQAVAIWLREFASAMAVPSIIQGNSPPSGILKFTQSEASSPELLSLDLYNTKSQAEGVCLSRAGCFSDGTR